MSKSRLLTNYVSSFFKDELYSARALSPHTYRSYRIAIKSLINFLEVSLQKNLFEIYGDDVSYENIYAWILDQAQENNWSSRTWNSRLSAIKTFVRFLGRTNIRYLDLVARVELIRNKKNEDSPADYMTLEEFDSVLRLIKSNKFTDFRDKLIFQILFFSGARVSELTGLRTQDIIFLKDRSVSLHYFGKGRKGRTVIIKEKATLQNIKKFLEIRFRNQLSSEYFFHGHNDSRMSEKNIGRIVKKYFSSLNNKIISPHSFRHSAAMHWLESGMGLFAVSALLGHEDIRTTTKYLKSTFKIKSDALESCGQNEVLSRVFRPKFSTNSEFWDHLGIEFDMSR